MMHRVLAFLFVGVLLTGCGVKSPPARTFAKYDLSGGRYFIDCEDTGGGSTLSFTSTNEGMDGVKELYEFSWGANRLLRIEDGKLNVDGADRGTLERGDRITIRPSGEVLVNGNPR